MVFAIAPLTDSAKTKPTKSAIMTEVTVFFIKAISCVYCLAYVGDIIGWILPIGTAAY
jgi:hypothetical protein